MAKIPMHPKKGINPYLTYCSRCGKEGNEILLLGNNDKIYHCPSCDTKHLGRPTRGLCQCGSSVVFDRKVDENERLPGGLCDACKEEKETFKQVVAEGGIHWKCSDCNKSGVIKADHPLAKVVREQMNIFPPDPCGVSFTQKECPSCGEGS